MVVAEAGNNAMQKKSKNILMLYLLKGNFMKQLMEKLLWEMMEYFYSAWTLFHQEHQTFLRRIQELQTQKQIKNTKRLMKSLSLAELANLVPYESFKDLLEQQIRPLRKLSDQFKRNTYSNTDCSYSYFDEYLANLYHGLSILQSEGYQWGLKILDCMEGPTKSTRSKQEEEQEQKMFAHFKENLLPKMQSFKKLFDAARAEIEKLIYFHKDSSILLRSLYFFGQEIIGPSYGPDPEKGFLEFIKKIYAPDHILELYTRVGYSFISSGFFDEARKTVKQAQAFLDKTDYEFTKEGRKRFQDLVSEQSLSAST